MTLGIPIDTDPTAALLGALSTAVGHEQALRAELEAAGTLAEIDDVAYARWCAERDRLVKVGEACVRAGVAERIVAQVEANGAALAASLSALIDDPALALSEEQRLSARAAVARHLRSLPTAS